MPQPNKTKPPLQVLAVAEGNSEKNKVWDEAHDGVIINHIKHKTLSTRIRHCVFSFPISVWFGVCHPLRQLTVEILVTWLFKV
jgi:hypothetical protein